MISVRYVSSVFYDVWILFISSEFIITRYSEILFVTRK